MKLFYTDIFELPLPGGHFFPMAKYRLLRERVENSELQQICRLHVPAAATDEQLARVHTADYIRNVVEGKLNEQQIRRIGFPWSRNLVERSRRSVGATICAVVSAMEDRAAVNLAGGTHHAFADQGQGYCVFNDVAVAIRNAQALSLVGRVLVIDADVHQGNGTAEIFRECDDVFTFSIHSSKSFPSRKTVGDLEIALANGTMDADYLHQLQTGLECCPTNVDLVIYLAGADPYEGDRLGGLRLTQSGLKRRDEMVLNFCKTNDLPIAIAMAGGYADEVRDIVDIQFETIRTAAQHFEFFTKGFATAKSD